MKSYREDLQRSLSFEIQSRTQGLILYVDGASRGNPGEAGIGIVIKGSDGQTIQEISKTIGVTTNNRAEYIALLEGLRAVTRLKNRSPSTVHGSRLTVFSDSELLVKQLKGQYKVRDSNLKTLYYKVSIFLNGFKDIDIRHINREYNKEADKLANKAIDETRRSGNPK